LRHLQARVAFALLGKRPWPEKFCSKTQRTIVGAAKSVPLGYKKSPSGRDCRSDCCGRSRRRSGSEVNARRRQGGEVNESDEKAGAQVKAKSCAQGVEKEKTLNGRPSPPPCSARVAAYRAAGSGNSLGSGDSLWN
jgi:hypothetical protein